MITTTTTTHGHRLHMRRSITIRRLGTLAALAAGASFACQTPNPKHCHYATGDQTCAERFGSKRPFCVGPGDACEGVSDNYGCVAELPPQECYSPCGDSTFAAEDSSCLTAADETGDETTGDDPSDAESTGDDNDDDDEPAPVCGDGVAEGDEECDDGNQIDDDECSNNCVAATCGDGIVQESIGENCDEGIDNGGELCNAQCQIPGTVLVTLQEVIDGGQPFGIRATFWQGRPTAVIGNWGTINVWEIDPERLSTYRVRGTTEWLVPGITGALGLESGELLAAAAATNKAAVRFDDDLNIQWQYQPVDSAPTEWIVGVAPIVGGAMLGAAHVSSNVDNKYSGYWAVGITDLGATLWSAVEVTAGTSDIYARDLRGVGENRGVLLSSLPSNHGFRIYDSSGTVLSDTSVIWVAVSGLCAGKSGFFLVGGSNNTSLFGYDADGAPTFNASFQIESSGQYVGVDCAARLDHSPLVAASILSEQSTTTTLEVIGFSRNKPSWRRALDINAGSTDDPAVLLDEENSRAWFFVNGQQSGGQPIVYAAAIAI